MMIDTVHHSFIYLVEIRGRQITYLLYLFVLHGFNTFSVIFNLKFQPMYINLNKQLQLGL